MWNWGIFPNWTLVLVGVVVTWCDEKFNLSADVSLWSEHDGGVAVLDWGVWSWGFVTAGGKDEVEGFGPLGQEGEDRLNVAVGNPHGLKADSDIAAVNFKSVEVGEDSLGVEFELEKAEGLELNVPDGVANHTATGTNLLKTILVGPVICNLVAV